MSTIQIIGIVLLFTSGILLYFGYQASRSPSGQVAETFTGRLSDSTTLYFIVGATAAVGGFAMVLLRG